MKKITRHIQKYKSSIILIFITILSFFTYLITKKFNPSYKKQTIGFLIIFFILSLFYVLGKHKKQTHSFFMFWDFVSPFFSRLYNSWFKLIWIIVFTIGLPYIFFSIHYEDFNLWKRILLNLDSSYYYKIWLSFLAIAISSRIYFEVKNKGKNFEEFISIIESQFINNSQNGEKLYIILPTFFIGWHNSKYFHKKFINSIKEIARNKEKELHLGMLSFKDICLNSKITEIEELKNKLDKGLNTDMNKDFFACLASLNDKSLLFKFHDKWYMNKNPNDHKNRLDFTLKLLNHLKELNELAIDLDSNFEIKHLNKDYFFKIEDEKGKITNSDFFMFANINSKNYFFGDFIINDQEEIKFNSTNFSVNNIENQIKSFFNDFIASRTK